MDSATTLRHVRRRAGLTLRGLADRAGTSHATLAAYEAGRKTPRADTLDRLVRAAGFGADLELRTRADQEKQRTAKARELEAALDLAEEFPIRHDGQLSYPVFGRTVP
jgi:transcriptional regulator with XRE-family HTH domain